MTTEDNKLEILRGVEQGKLSIEEGAHLLEILDGQAGTQDTTQPAASPLPAERMEVPTGWRMLWGSMLFLGVIFLGPTGFWLSTSYARSGMGVGFWFALFFILVSCLIVFLGYELLASKRWMIVRVSESGEKKIDVWVPLPLHIAKWVFETFGDQMPEEVKSRNILQILDEMENNGDDNQPYIIDVDEKDHVHANIKVEC